MICLIQITSAEWFCRCLISRIAHQHGRKPFSWSVSLRFVQAQHYSLALGTSDCHPPVVTVRPDWLNSVGLFFAAIHSTHSRLWKSNPHSTVGLMIAKYGKTSKSLGVSSEWCLGLNFWGWNGCGRKLFSFADRPVVFGSKAMMG